MTRRSKGIFSFSAILICIVYAVCETLENRKNNSKA